ncbi:MAG: amino acid adenylation protein, partial [Gammaproteobacteria bacterium]
MEDALPFTDSPSLACRFAAVAAAYPERTALQWAGGSYCYRELDARSAALAARMAAAGMGAGQHIGLHIPRSPELMLAILATIRLGAVYVPLDTAYPV